MVVKALNAYSHWAVEDEFERTAPTLVFLLMLGCRLVVDWQVARREREEAEAGQKGASAAAELKEDARQRLENKKEQ